MIFFDASAAAKRYFREIGSDRVNELWSGPQFISSLTILHCELASALNRKFWDRALPPRAYHTLKEQIRRDMVNIWTVPVDAGLIEVSVRLLDSHPLKALDSLYLAGGLSLQENSKESVLFVSADRQLLRAAQTEGLGVLDPETTA